MDVIVAYCERWDTPLRTSKHHYIERLAADGHRILYVEVPANPFSAIRRFGEFTSKVLPRIRADVESVAENIWVMTGFVPLPYHSALWGIFDRPLVNLINQRVLLPRLKAAQAKLGFQTPILLSYYPLAFPIIRELGVTRTIFHIVDEWQGMTGIPSSMAKLTQSMLAHANVTIVTSERLFERYRHVAKRIELLRHGTDIALFGPVARGKISPEPRLLALPGRKIGYYGALHKLDAMLISQVAQARPDWTFVFVGPISGAQGMGRLEVFPSNVHFFGEIARANLPAFLAGLDVFWMPFVVNELTQSMSPIKIFEVLSAGLPMVTSDLIECRAVAAQHALFASSTEEHLAQLERAASLRNPEEARQRAESMHGYDWDQRYQQFLSLLQH
jgi:glycosyltransferase involved in cell wall biosynthesis